MFKLYYRMTAFIKGLRRRWLIDKAEYKSYGGHDVTHGYAGWYDVNNRCIAFRRDDGTIQGEW